MFAAAGTGPRCSSWCCSWRPACRSRSRRRRAPWRHRWRSRGRAWTRGRTQPPRAEGTAPCQAPCRPPHQSPPSCLLVTVRPLHFNIVIVISLYCILYITLYPVNFTSSVGSGFRILYRLCFRWKHVDVSTNASTITLLSLLSLLYTTLAPLLQQVTTLQAFISLNNIHILYQLDKQ